MSGAAALAGGAGILGDAMSMAGQSSANAVSREVAQQEMAWQEKMSDTAMQRRVTDLKAAGLNPVLAAGGPGAMVGSPVMPNIQNAGASFAGLGNQVSSAAQLQTQSAQIEALKAGAAKDNASARNVDSQTDDVIPAQVQKIQSETGLNQERAQEVHSNVTMLNYAISAGVPMELAAQAAIKTHLMQADQQERQDTLTSLIRARNDVNYATAIGARNMYNASDTLFARIMSFFAVPGVSNAISAVRTAIP